MAVARSRMFSVGTAQNALWNSPRRRHSSPTGCCREARGRVIMASNRVATDSSASSTMLSRTRGKNSRRWPSESITGYSSPARMAPTRSLGRNALVMEPPPRDVHTWNPALRLPTRGTFDGVVVEELGQSDERETSIPETVDDRQESAGGEGSGVAAGDVHDNDRPVASFGERVVHDGVGRAAEGVAAGHVVANDGHARRLDCCDRRPGGASSWETEEGGRVVRESAQHIFGMLHVGGHGAQGESTEVVT